MEYFWISFGKLQMMQLEVGYKLKMKLKSSSFIKRYKYSDQNYLTYIIDEIVTDE